MALASTTKSPNELTECSLLGATALVVQGLMGVFVLLSLLYKRHRESPPRPWRIWIFDVSKQVVGQAFVHGVNVLVSDISSHHSTGGNACVFYFLNILIDTTLGVLLIYTSLHAYTHVLSEKLQLKGFQSGQYGTPPSWNFWMRQTAVYLIALTTMKLIVLTLFAIFPGMFLIGEWLLSWTEVGKDAGKVQIVFTMGVFPILMNVLQFWLIDSIVKGKPNHYTLINGETGPSRDLGPAAEQEVLFNADGEGDDTGDVESQRAVLQKLPAAPKSSERPRRTGEQSALSFLDASFSYPPVVNTPQASSSRPRKNSSDRNLPVRQSGAKPPTHGSDRLELWEDSWGDEDEEDVHIEKEEWSARNRSWGTANVKPAAWITAPSRSVAV